MPNEPMDYLDDSAKEHLAEREAFGKVSERELERTWNNMVSDFERGNYVGAIRKSREVQGLIRVIVRNYNDFVNIRDILEKIRYLICKELYIDASWMIEDCKNEIIKTCIHIGQGRE
jgi:hypothetical protein